WRPQWQRGRARTKCCDRDRPWARRRRGIPASASRRLGWHGDPAGCELGWREYPIAGSGPGAAQGRATGRNEGFPARHERGRELHATEFVVCSRKAPPALARRQIARGRGKALFEGLDQCFLPGLTLELPSAEANEDCDRRQREDGWHR